MLGDQNMEIGTSNNCREEHPTTCTVAEVQGGMRHTNKSMEDRERRRFLVWPIATRILHLGKRRILAPKP